MTTHTPTATTEALVAFDPSRQCPVPPGGVLDAIPGAVHDGDPGLTAAVLRALALARSHHDDSHEIDDRSGPHEHHWLPIAWVCRGCWRIEEADW